MAEFLGAIAVFLLAHVGPPSRPVRSRLIAWLGRRTYLGCYSLVSLTLMVWIVSAARCGPPLATRGFAPLAWRLAECR